MGRSLADLLDAQEKRGGGHVSRGGNGSSRRWQEDRPNRRLQPPRDRDQGTNSRWHEQNDDERRQNSRAGDHGRGAASPPTSSRWTNVNLSPSANGSRASYGRNGDNGRGGNRRGPSMSYEERRARIEKEAFEASERAASGRCNRHGNADKEEDEDISTWIGPLVEDNETGEKRCTYYQDRDKKYPFYCGEEGHELLQTLMRENAALLELNQQRIEEEAGRLSETDKPYSPDVIVRIGKGLYAHKPTLRTKGVTWSTEEYSHPGLQRMYLRMKSIQRFTEIWALLERADAIGTFDWIYEKGAGAVRVAAVGGGPGYELLAARIFFKEKCPDITLDLICMDVCGAWRPCAESLGFRFVQYDITDESTDPLAAAGLGPGDLDLCIISCVMIYCTTKQTMEMFYKLLHDGGVGAALVSERGEKNMACTMFEELGGSVIRLIDQSNGLDERQAIWCSNDFYEKNQLPVSSLKNSNSNRPSFPNVPFEEHKYR